MKWITRSHVHVDRVASPWLITRFVDSEAEFIFVPKNQVMEVAERERAIAFDTVTAGLAIAFSRDEPRRLHCPFPRKWACLP